MPSRPETDASEAPAPSSRPAAIPCVSGRQRPTACTAPGSRSNGTLAPDTSSIVPPTMSAKSETLRPRSPRQPRHRPNDVHANDATSAATARPPSSLAEKWTPRIRLQIANAVAATRNPVRIEGTARPRNSAKPVRRRRQQRRERLRAPLAADRAPHPEEPGDRDRHERVADEEELVRLDARQTGRGRRRRGSRRSGTRACGERTPTG